MNALEYGFKIPLYLLKIMRNYLKDRELFYETKDRDKSHVGQLKDLFLAPTCGTFYMTIYYV